MGDFGEKTDCINEKMLSYTITRAIKGLDRKNRGKS